MPGQTSKKITFWSIFNQNLNLFFPTYIAYIFKFMFQTIKKNKNLPKINCKDVFS